MSGPAPGAASSPRPLPVLGITAAYPAPSEPTRAVFIENLFRELSLLDGADGGRRFRPSVLAPRIARADPLRETRYGIEVRRFRYPSGGKRLKEAGGIPWLALSAYLASGTAAAFAAARSSGARAIHAHWVLPAGVIGAAVSSMTGVPLLVHAHGSDIHRYALGSRAARRAAAWAISRAARVLAVSAELADILDTEFQVPRERLAILPMGIDGRVFGPGDRERERAALGIDGSRAEILFAGDIVPDKGVLAVAREIAAGALGPRPVRLDVAGDGPDRAEIEALQRDPRRLVRWLGRLEPGKLAPWYRAADLFVLPSRSEGAPVSIQEALASGLPVVVTAVGGIPGMVRPGIEGWLAPAGASPSRFLEEVAKALDDAAGRERMRAGLLASKMDLTAARRARELAEILDEVIR